MLIKSINLIKENKVYLLNWLPLFILIFIIIIYIFFNPLYIKQIINYKKNFEIRTSLVNNIKKEKNVNQNKYIENVSNEVSCNGKIYVYINTDTETLVEFCISPGFPDGGTSLFYSSHNERFIKDNLISVENIKKLNDNWYIVNFK